MLYVVLDILGVPINGNLYGTHEPQDIVADEVPMQIIFTWPCILTQYCSINMSYSIDTTITVSIALSSPQDWPPLFGRLQVITTARDYWENFGTKYFRE
jgi:hypothetical protein